MKIRKLIITGFGPYAERQELDFESSLDGKNMFVITEILEQEKLQFLML